MLSTPPAERQKESDSDAHPYMLVNKLIAEFIGGLLLIFIGMSQNLAAGGLVVGAFAHGFVLLALIVSLGHISGGHFNPAVTLAILLCGKMKPLDAVCYIIAQMLGGFFGALFCRGIMDSEQWSIIAGGATFLNHNHSWFQGIVAEVITTWLLTQTILLTAVDTSTNILAPVAIASTVIASILAIGPVSGASLNPARSFGPAVASLFFETDTSIWPTQYIYYIGPAIGAFLTAIFYRTVLTRDNGRFF